MTRTEAADQMSDRIVDVVNAELAIMRREDRVDAMALFGGQCLALLSVLRTAPQPLLPEIQDIADAAQAYLARVRDCFAACPLLEDE